MDGKAIDAQQRYQKLVKDNAPKPKVGRNLWRAFLVGGALECHRPFCTAYLKRSSPQRRIHGDDTRQLDFHRSRSDRLGVYDSIAQWGGAGRRYR